MTYLPSEHFVQDDMEKARRLIAKGLMTGDIADVMQQMSLDNGCMAAEIKPLSPGMRVVGPALPCYAPSGAYHTILKAFYAAKKGDVIVAGTGDACNTAVMGDFFVRSCIAKGIGGIITDGCFRDSRAISDLAFPVFARGVTPRAETRMLVGTINLSIQCGGVVINPGDLVVADDDGVVVIPTKHADAILDKAWKERSAELDLLKQATKRRVPPHEMQEIRGPFEKEWAEKSALQRQHKIVP